MSLEERVKELEEQVKSLTPHLNKDCFYYPWIMRKEWVLSAGDDWKCTCKD